MCKQVPHQNKMEKINATTKFFLLWASSESTHHSRPFKYFNEFGDVSPVFVGDECEHSAGPPSAPRATGPVHVLLKVGGQVVIDDKSAIKILFSLSAKFSKNYWEVIYVSFKTITLLLLWVGLIGVPSNY